MSKLIGGFNTDFDQGRIYADGIKERSNDIKTTYEVKRETARYISAPWEKYRTFRFYEPTKEREEYLCECVAEGRSYDAFVCGYGISREAAFKDCVLRLFDWLEYIN